MRWCKNTFRIPFGWFLLHLLWNIGATIQCKGQNKPRIISIPLPIFSRFNTPTWCKTRRRAGSQTGCKTWPKTRQTTRNLTWDGTWCATLIKTRRRAGTWLLHHMGWWKNAFRIPFGWFLLHLFWNIGATIQCKGLINQELFPYTCPFLGKI